MTFCIKKIKRKLFFLLFFFLVVSGISVYCLSPLCMTEDEKFEKFCAVLFQKELSGNTLNLHYSLAYPEKWNIHTDQISLGRISTDVSRLCEQYRQYEHTLRSFTYSELSTENQCTLDSLLLTLHTEQSAADYSLLEEYLSPTLGIQAQLPILLAEYTFRSRDDIYDYLSLLKDIRPYFRSILDFEKEKSDAGFFMCDETVDRIQDQCFAFITDPESNYMLDIFSEKLDAFAQITPEEKQELLSIHKTLILDEVIPAYKELIMGLENLYGTGKNPSGLYYFPNGTSYYQYLLQSNAGIYTSIPALEYQLIRQLSQETQTLYKLLKENPDLTNTPIASDSASSLTPAEMMPVLLDMIQNDFPAPASTNYELRYVHESMEDYLSPAFYLTPPIDTGSPNIIYLNQGSLLSDLEIFTTLSHEGYPGHLYQTTYFTASDALPIRHLFASNGYVEGWATYVESYAYNYAAAALDIDPSLTNLTFLNRSTSLCLYSLLDIGIHYRGWTEEETLSFLKNFGITDMAAVHEIYLHIIENPANYLQYYGGYLQFLNLKNAQQQRLKEDFSLMEFHRSILEIGPVPFPVLEKYMNLL